MKKKDNKNQNFKEVLKLKKRNGSSRTKEKYIWW